MARQNTKTNEGLVELISDLKAQTRSTGAALWRDVANRLEKSRKNWAEPNLSRLDGTCLRTQQFSCLVSS